MGDGYLQSVSREQANFPSPGFPLLASPVCSAVLWTDFFALQAGYTGYCAQTTAVACLGPWILWLITTRGGL